MAHYCPLTVCKCECALDTQQEKFYEFLSALNENFTTMRSTLITLTLHQPLEEMYNVVGQEEDLKVATHTTEATQKVTAYTFQSQSCVHQSSNN